MRLLSRLLDWLFPIRVEARCEADDLMEAFGDGAYFEARRFAREADAGGDKKRSEILWRAKHKIAKRSDFPFGLDTATRYLEAAPLGERRPPDATLH